MSSIFDADFLSTLPTALKGDADALALAGAAASELKRMLDGISRVSIYPRIGQLPEKILDVLAADLHVDWYDPSYDLEEKRRTIRDSVKVHRRLGTKYAVETALSGVFPGSNVEEWHDYGGAPFTFRVSVNVDGGAPAAKVEKALGMIGYYKNLRSHMDGLGYETKKNVTTFVAAAVGLGVTADVWPDKG